MKYKIKQIIIVNLLKLDQDIVEIYAIINIKINILLQLPMIKKIGKYSIK